MTETPREHEETNITNPVGKVENFVSKHFVRLLVWLAVSGGALAIFGPWLLYVTGLTGETDANLRLHILYVTGGTIAVLGLVETHRKNTTDRIKADADIQNYQASQDHQAKTLAEQARHFTETIAKEREKIEADKAKNEQDHIRQVHAERRSRYTTAIEQLSSDKASIRLGGVYTLVGLVDEWLADDKTIPNIEERHKEGQVIINNLCAYTRSSFLLAERAKQLDKPYAKDLQKNFGGDIEKFNEDKQYFAQEKAALEEERQVRQSIIKEMREHLSKNYSKSGPWSDLDYDFSNAHFFYPVNFNDSYFDASLNFFGATFTERADFSGAKFTQASFSGAKFTGYADFIGATFTEHADFSGAKFTEGAYFFEATFTETDFSETTFVQANFSRATFTQGADFSGAIFHSEPSFTNVLGKARFSHKVAPESYSFGVDPDSPCKIEIEEQEHNGTKFIIPKGTILFDPDELSRIEEGGSYVLIIIRMPMYDPSAEVPFYTIPLGIVIEGNTIITICSSSCDILGGIASGQVKGITLDDFPDFIIKLMSRADTTFLRYLKEINRQTTAMQRELQGPIENKEIVKLLNLQKSLEYFTTSLTSNQLLLQKLRRTKLLNLDEDDYDWLDDVDIDNRQAIGMAETYNNILAGLMDTFTSVISNNLNVSMKRLTVINLVLRVPTFIGSTLLPKKY